MQNQVGTSEKCTLTIEGESIDIKPSRCPQQGEVMLLGYDVDEPIILKKDMLDVLRKNYEKEKQNNHRKISYKDIKSIGGRPNKRRSFRNPSKGR